MVVAKGSSDTRRVATLTQWGTFTAPQHALAIHNMLASQEQPQYRSSQLNRNE
jgi:hypothetical protein